MIVKSKRIEGKIIGFTGLEGSKLSRFRNKAGVGFFVLLHKLTFRICKKSAFTNDRNCCIIKS